MNIRPLGPSDCPALGALARESYAAAFGHDMSPADLDGLLARLSPGMFAEAMQRDTLLGAFDGARMTGFVQTGEAGPGMRSHVPEPPAALADLRRLYVAPAAQGQGIGSTLLDAALAAMPPGRAVVLDVWSRNDGAIRLYRSRGFEMVGEYRLMLESGPSPDPDFVMLRPGHT